MKRLAIIGAGELGIQALHYAKLQGQFEVAGFVDDTKDKGTLVQGLPVICTINKINDFYGSRFDCVIIAIGYQHFNFRHKLFDRLVADDVELATIISPHVWIDPTAKIGRGCFLYPGVLIEKDTVIEDNVVLTVNAMVAHNCIVHRHSFIAGAAAIAGRCEIGERCMIGVNATIIDEIKICDDVVVGAGCIVRKSISKPGTYIDGKLFADTYLLPR